MAKAGETQVEMQTEQLTVLGSPYMVLASHECADLGRRMPYGKALLADTNKNSDKEYGNRGESFRRPLTLAQRQSFAPRLLKEMEEGWDSKEARSCQRVRGPLERGQDATRGGGEKGIAAGYELRRKKSGHP